jgi:Zn-dependent peptidase ImmA (M78 family)
MTGPVPYLSEEQIERDTVILLGEFANARGAAVAPPVPIEDIVEKHLKLRIDFDDTHRLFGVPRTGLSREPDILGAMFFDEGRIVIDESLDPEENPTKEGRYRFTLAHEGGHWRLHRHLFAKDPAQSVLLGESEMPSVVCRSSEAKVRIEWQADFHASCLLMPRKLVLEAWRRQFGTYEPFLFNPSKHNASMVRRRWSGLHSLGEILSEMFEPDYVYFFDSIAEALAPVFAVSRQAMRIRLEKLGLLLREAPRQRSLAGGA